MMEMMTATTIPTINSAATIADVKLHETQLRQELSLLKILIEKHPRKALAMLQKYRQNNSCKTSEIGVVIS